MWKLWESWEEIEICRLKDRGMESVKQEETVMWQKSLLHLCAQELSLQTQDLKLCYRITGDPVSELLIDRA
jgi:hypothetical protein